MAQRFHLFVREHHTGWFTSWILTHPDYAAHGPFPSKLREEIEEVVGEDLRSGALRLREPTHFEKLSHKSLSLEVRAVEHDRLVTVPLRISVVYYPVDDGGTFEVRLPRIDQTFRIHGEENVMAWAEERARGWFHLKTVRELLEVQYEKSERVELLEIAGHKSAPRKKGAQQTAGDPLQLEPPHPLASFGAEWVEEAKHGRLPRAEFRDRLVEELLEVLGARQQPSALLVGPSGVGKTAVIQEAAHRIAQEKAGPRMNGSKLWSITGPRMLAGARFLGEWQARAQQVVRLVVAERGVLYVGNLLELISAGGARSGLSLSQFLLAPVSSGELVLLAEATEDQLSVADRLEPALTRALRRIPVPSLPPEETTALLERTALRLERERSVRWGPGAVAQGLDVVARFGDAGSLPGSGIKLLEQMAQLGGKAAGKAATLLQPRDAIRAFSRMSGFPEPLIDPDQRLEVDQVRDHFARRVIGQPLATELLTNVIMLLKAGLNDPSRPLGSFLFMGPTGVGKTESALALAEWLFGDRGRMVRLDMSEYGYPGSALRLVDGPDGQGDLTRRVRELPFSVVLLDEIEKADPGVYDLLLQLLGEGRLTDGTSRTVRFDHTIVIMTSNLGAERRAPIGYDPAEGADLAARFLEAAERFFRPELINRLDHLVPFGDLDRGSLRAIADKMMVEALGREGLVRRGVRVSIDPSVVELILEQGFDPRYGARPMKRAVEALVTVPLARALAAGGPQGSLRLVVLDGAVRVQPS